MPAAISRTGTIRNSVSDGGEEERVVVRRAQRDAEPAPGDDGERAATTHRPDEAQLLADGGQRQIGVARGKVARVAKPEAGAEHAAGRESAQIACAI